MGGTEDDGNGTVVGKEVGSVGIELAGTVVLGKTGPDGNGDVDEGRAVNGNVVEGDKGKGNDVDGSGDEGDVDKGRGVRGNEVDGSGVDGSGDEGDVDKGKGVRGNEVDGSGVDGSGVELLHGKDGAAAEPPGSGRGLNSPKPIGSPIALVKITGWPVEGCQLAIHGDDGASGITLRFAAGLLGIVGMEVVGMGMADGGTKEGTVADGGTTVDDGGTKDGTVASAVNAGPPRSIGRRRGGITTPDANPIVIAATTTSRIVAFIGENDANEEMIRFGCNGASPQLHFPPLCNLLTIRSPSRILLNTRARIVELFIFFFCALINFWPHPSRLTLSRLGYVMISEAGRPWGGKVFPIGNSQIWLVYHLQNCLQNGHRKL